MSTPIQAGVFAKTQLPAINKNLNDFWPGSMMEKDRYANVAIFNIIKNLETAKYSSIWKETSGGRGARKRVGGKIIIDWLAAPSLTERDVQECSFIGPELGTEGMEYEITKSKEWGISINYEKATTDKYTINQQAAEAIRALDKAASEYLAKAAVTAIELHRGINLFAGTKGTVDQANKVTTIAAENFNANCLGYLKLVGDKNLFNSPVVIAGSAMEEARINSKVGACCTDKTDENKFGIFPWLTDSINIDMVTGEEPVYLYNRGTLAIPIENKYPLVPEYWPELGQERWRQKSQFLNGVYYDMSTYVTCVDNEIVRYFKLIARWDFHLNPTGANEDNTGIFKFVVTP